MKPVLLAAGSSLALACLCDPRSLIPKDSEPEPLPSDGGATSELASVIENEHFTLIQLHPVGSRLGSLLPLYAEAAIAQGRKPFVEWDAEW